MDLREEMILTIDPPDAKDFDDAISIKRLEGKGDLGEFVDHAIGTEEAKFAALVTFFLSTMWVGRSHE